MRAWRWWLRGLSWLVLCAGLLLMVGGCGDRAPLTDAAVEADAALPPPPSCTDGQQNGDESDLDCGGSCSPCTTGQACVTGTDCASGECVGAVCAAPPSCTDQIKNGSETDRDCGGTTCAPCDVGQACQQDGDCAAMVCTQLICRASQCVDLVRDGEETDVDCGGPSCPGCPSSAACTVDGDCASGICAGGQCAAATCSDGVRNGGELAVDCGGPCFNCPSATDPTVSTNTWAASAFLYSGANPPQRAVTAGAIDAVRVGVLRGRALSTTGAPLAGVAVSVHQHPELGFTESASDGTWALAVNGGGDVVVELRRGGYLPVQRRVAVPHQAWVAVEDVALTALDPNPTTISFAAPVEVARGSAITDDAGTRRATMMFREGTAVIAELPGGMTMPLAAITVRATEYTVGASGPSAMPGELPPFSGYTYAVELSVDEALAMNASRVTFTRPVASYVENFLGFPVGEAVPLGYYDRDQARWIAADNGRVIAILAIDGGLAELDVTGAGIPATPAELAALGIDDVERAKLAELYPAGQTLWRFAVTHFTPWDCNWPYAPPADAVYPDQPKPPPPPKDPCEAKGSIIECETRNLGEQIPITGTPFQLHYRSQRTAGAQEQRTLRIPLSGATLPASVQEILLEIHVAGRRLEFAYAPAPNLRHSFTWDGLDVWGRRHLSAEVKVRIGYRYEALYEGPASGERSFGSPSRRPRPGLTTTDRGRRRFFLWQEYTTSLEHWDVQGQELGGWTLGPHHTYDPKLRALELGNGQRHEVRDWHPIRRLAAPTGLPFLRDFVYAPDGTRYDVRSATTFSGICQIYRVDAANAATLIAGTGNCSGPNGEDGPALAADIPPINAMARGPDGSLYLSFKDMRWVWRVTPAGVLERVAGDGNAGNTGDGGPARNATMNLVLDLDVAPDGTLYIATQTHLRAVWPDGTITTPYTGSAWSVAVAPDGSVLIADGQSKIVRLGRDGRAVQIVGAGPLTGDGGPAAQTYVSYPYGLLAASDGSFYFVHSEGTSRQLRQVGVDGIIRGVMGYGTSGGDGAPAYNTALGDPVTARLSPAGQLVTVDGAYGFQEVRPPLPPFSAAALRVAHPGGGEIYELDAFGRHVRTRSPRGTLRYAFGYDAGGRLISITDGAGQVTTIERTAAGAPTAIVAPGGARTELTLDAAGRLASVVGPGNRTVALAYTADGLLTSITDVRGMTSSFTYTATGQLATDTDPSGVTTTLTSTLVGAGLEVAIQRGTAPAQRFTAEPQADGTTYASWIDATGAVTSSWTLRGAGERMTRADGTTATWSYAADPRWNFQALVPQRRTLTTPGGRSLTVITSRYVSPSSFDDPYAITQETENLRIGSRGYSTIVDHVNRLWTWRRPSGVSSVLELDTLDRPLTWTVAPGLEPVRYSYDAAGRMSKVERGGEHYLLAYNALDLATAATDATGATLRWEYDAAGRATAIQTPLGHRYGLSFDAGGNLLAMTLPRGGVIQQTWDPLGRRASFGPMGGATASWSYNDARQVEAVMLGSGRALTATRDAGGRVSSAAIGPDGTLGVEYVGATRRMSRLQRTVGGVTQDLQVALDGPLVTGLTFAGPAASSFTLRYDANLQLAGRTRAGEAEIAWPRDADGNPTAEGVFSFARGGPGGNLSQITGPSLQLDYAYDAAGRVVGRTLTVAGQPRYSVAVTHDAAGRIGARTESVGAASTMQTFAYDPDGQLTTVMVGAMATEAYAYDADGNRASRQVGAGAVESSTFDLHGQVISRDGVAYAYNADGQLVGRGGDALAYSASGELLSYQVTAGPTVSYAYDGFGRRTARTDASGTTQYLYANLDSPFEVTVSIEPSGDVTRYYYDDFGQLYAFTRAGATYYVGTDQARSVRLIVDDTGAEVRRIDYDAYGVVVADTNPAFTIAVGFAGGIPDPTSGLVRFGARDLDPLTGRWTALDPSHFGGDHPNLYVYATNDPVGRIDPSGLFSLKLAGNLGIGLGLELTWIPGEGLGVCGEAGFGVGGKVQIAPSPGGGTLQPSGLSVVGQVGAKFGFTGIGAELTARAGRCPGFSAQGSISLGPLELDIPDSKIKDLKVGNPTMGFGADASITARACGRF